MSRSPRRKAALSDPGPPLSPLPPTPEPPPGAWRWALPVLIGLYLVLTGLHAAWAPVGQTAYQNAPDEVAHVQYARAIAAGHLPTQASSALDPSGQSYEWHQPPLYYLWAALFLPLGEHGMRLASILLGIVSILLVYQTARLLFPNEPFVAISAAGMAALLPGHVAITSTVNNDVLLEVCFSATLWLLLQSLLRGFTLWRAGWLGVVLGLALLTKATALLLLPIVFLALLFLWRSGETPSNLVRGALWMLAILLLFSGWWFARNLHLYGELLPLRTFDQAFAGTAQAAPRIQRLGGWGYAQGVGILSFLSFWAVFSNKQSAVNGEQIFLPLTVYALPLLITLAALAGMGRLHFQRRTLFTSAQQRGLWLMMCTLGLVGFSFALFLAKYFQAQGRYLYPALLPVSVLLALGLQSVFPDKRKAWASGLLLGVLSILALLFLTSVQAAI